jgi:hypothetical protein
VFELLDARGWVMALQIQLLTPDGKLLGEICR